jgi:hypothetical protein
MNISLKRIIGIAICAPLLLANEGGCDSTPSAASKEQAVQNTQMEQFLRNQPVPSFDWSLERHMLIQLYAARQRATNTFSVVQSEFTGKVLWSCPSIGFPLPYATQLTNPQQVRYFNEHLNAVVAQQEPNGLFTPQQSEATWVPCVDEKGKITPVYEEKHVTVFLRPVEERDGQLVVIPGKSASLTIDTQSR